MGSSPITVSSLIGSGSPGALLSSYASTALQEAAALTASGLVADVTHLWPVQSAGTPQRINLAGDSSPVSEYHKLMTQGQFLETSIGGAMNQIMSKKVDLDEKIQHYLDLNRVAIDCKLPHSPRVAKMVVDSTHFIQTVQKYIQRQLAMAQSLLADVNILLAVATRMVQMIQANITALANLLAQICNWGLPALPSLPVRLGGRYNFSGFNLNQLTGFSFSPNLSFNLNSTFSLCIPHTAAPSASSSNPSSVTSDGNTYQVTPAAAQAGGSFANPSQYTDPAYIAQLQATATPVYDPTTFSPTATLSLPAAASIVSNYSLTPALYEANICSLCSDLNSIIIQPTDPDYLTTASAARELTLRQMLALYVNLGNLVETKFDPNLTACWLFYMQANFAGRAGVWIPNFETAYETYIVPSLAYLAENPVPYNNVLGGSGVEDAPKAIPLIALLEADTTNHLLWELSFLEAGLLGYTRNVAWDAAADSTYVAGATGTDPDYVPTTVLSSPTSTVVLGQDTASYPVACTFPQSIATVLKEVIALATVSIATTPGYQSTQPQFRFVYDEFAQASLVDRFSQFWRVFNANLQTLLTQDPYLVGFTMTYPAILNAAINPLADPSSYQTLESDAASRNRSWIPGSDLVPIPKALDLGGNGLGTVSPTDTTNGWSNQQLDAAAYLSRPDVQAQPIPVQIAMLQTNQSYASLAALKSSILNAVADAVTAANAAASDVGIPGWQVDTSATTIVPPGSPLTVPLPSTVLDQTGFVSSPTSIVIPSGASYILNGLFSWDPAGAAGSRTIDVLQNGSIAASVSSSDPGSDSYTLVLSVILALNEGDTIEIQASHSLSAAQNLLSGTFLGLTDTGAAAVAAVVPNSDALTSSTAGAITILSAEAFPAYTAISIGGDGCAHRLVTTDSGVTPLVDGIALNSSAAAGEPVQMAVLYGGQFAATGATSWTVGGALYATSAGAITQDASSISDAWLVYVGKAITGESFLYEPHLPVSNP